MKNKKVVVTGGAGFIGSNLIERLLIEGAMVTCLDNLSTGNLNNLRPFEANPNYTFVKGDICNLITCEQVCEGVDMVFHQAALGSVPRSVENPIPTHETNSTGFINMLHAASKKGVKRFVFASSSSVYGDHEDLPKVEDVTGKLLSPYAVTKYSNELNAKVFGELYGMVTIGLRYFNVFGKNQDPQGAYAAVIPKFVKAILSGDAIEIHGDGLQSRDFTYIDNVVDMNLLAATTDNSAAFNTIFNVAYGSHIQLVGLLDLLIKKVQIVRPDIDPVKVVHIETRKGDIKHSFADVSKAKSLLGFDPKVNLEDGLQKTVQWYCDLLHFEDTKSRQVAPPISGLSISKKSEVSI